MAPVTPSISTSVLELDVELAVTLIFDLGGEGVSSRDGSCTSIVSTGTVLRVSSVMASRYCNNLSQSSTKEGDLEESEGGDVSSRLQRRGSLQQGRGVHPGKVTPSS